MEKVFGKEWQKAKNNFDTCGNLGVTAEDHYALGGTPPDILKDNPGKTKLDFMSDDGIVQYLQEKKEELIKWSTSENRNNSFVKTYLPTLIKDTKITIRFLRSESRLPREFKNLDTEITVMQRICNLAPPDHKELLELEIYSEKFPSWLSELHKKEGRFSREMREKVIMEGMKVPKKEKEPWPLWLQGGRIGLIVALFIVFISPSGSLADIALFICMPLIHLVHMSLSHFEYDLTFFYGLSIFISYFLAGSLIGLCIQTVKKIFNKKK